MSRIGGGSPLAFEIGGSPSMQERYYKMLREAVGVGGSGADGSIVEAWRMARARGLVAAFADDRAAAQNWVNLVTDFLPIYEEILDLFENIDLDEQERRDAVTTKLTRLIEPVHDELEADLQAIDSRFEIIEPSRATFAITHYGRGFEDYNPASSEAAGPAFGDNYSATLWPNASTDFVCQIKIAIESQDITEEIKRKIENAKNLLREALPSWIDFWIADNTDRGFVLNTDLLSLGCFGDVYRGTHTGSDNQTTVLTDAYASFPTPDGLVGRYVYNLTDGSKGQITSNTGTTATFSGGLSGGSEDDFDNGDYYQIP